MNARHFLWILGWLITNPLLAQPIKVTYIVVIPNRNTLFTPDTIRDFNHDNQSDTVALSYQQNNFFVHFQTGRLPPPYAIRLNGYLRYEINTANDYAFFTNVPNGEYEVAVRSLARPDVSPAHLGIRIESPWWLRWWFLPLLFAYAMLLVGVGFYFLYRYRLRQVMHLHAVRESIARDLHDDMGSYLSSISVMSQSVTNLAQKDPQEAHALVHKIGEVARQVMDSMSDIIWSVNPDNDSMTQIVARMRDAGADLLEEQAIVFELDIDEAMLNSHLPLEQRRDFFLIYKEALNNIAKYARATHVWVRLERKEMALILTIQDDGVGFDLQQPIRSTSLGGNGLKNMRIRAEKMGGTLTIAAVPGLGTTILVKILLL